MPNQPSQNSLAEEKLAVEEGSSSGQGAKSSAHSSRVIGNILSLGSGDVVSRAIAFVGTAYLARRLGPVGFGMIGFASALFGYLALAVTAGFSDVGARDVARRPKEAPSIAASVILIRTVIAFFALAILAVFAWSLNKPPTFKLVIILMGCSLFSLALDTSWVHKGLERGIPVGVALILGQAIYVALVVLVVKRAEDVVRVPVAQFIGEMGAAILLAVPILRGSKIRLDFRKGLSLLRSSGLRTLTRLLRTLIYSFDVVLIGFYLSERQVGLYTAPYRICLLFLALAATIHVSYLPALTRAFTHSVEQVTDIAERSVDISAVIAAPIVVGGVILAAPLLQAFFGSEYVEGAAAFRLLILSIGFIFMHSAVRNILFVSDRMKTEVWLIGFASIVNVVLNLLLIPRYGILAAACTTALAEGLILTVGLTIIYKLGIRISFRFVLRPLVAAGVMGAFLIFVGSDYGLVFNLLTGAIVYLVALLIFRGVPQDVQPHLQNMISLARGARGS